MFRTLGRAFRIEPANLSKLDTIYHPTTLHMPSELTSAPLRSRRVRCSLPAVLMRAGTSKGLFIHRHHLPASESSWAGPLLAAMGSQNSDVRQIDGIGGATSTTSKVAVISPSTRPGIDVDYTFVQVAVGHETVDFSGNCGNMCAGVGPFAVQEGLVRPLPDERSVRHALLML
jgi:2-methylaconitate cis-trans-isomerase PrpF